MRKPGPDITAETGFRLKTLTVFVNSMLVVGMSLATGSAEGGDGGGMPGVEASTALQGDSEQGLSFDSDFLGMGGGIGGQHVDLGYFAHKGGLLPGNYAVQVTVNGKLVDQGRLVTFKSWPDQPGKLYACVTAGEMAEWWGIIASRRGAPEATPRRTDKGKSSNAPSISANALSVKDDAEHTGNADGSATAPVGGIPVSSGKAPPVISQAEADKPVVVVSAQSDDGERAGNSGVPPSLPEEDGDVSCPVGGVTAMVPYAKEVFDFNKRTLTLTVPQASLGPASRFRTPPHLWDEGMPAILMNYNYTGSQQTGGNTRTGSNFLGVNGQLSLLGWRMQNNLTWYQSQGGEQELNASSANAQRDFSVLGGGVLTVGRTTSGGGGVDSVSFTGISVASDDGMLDPKFTTYTPAITGIANSPATVTVRQYGKVIYQQNVPQGPFSITDFNRSGNGAVDVEIRESDGRTRHFTMAQASSGTLMNRGATSWSASVGKAANSEGYADDRFVQAGVSYGAWANTTLSGGALLSSNYQSLSVGGGLYAGAWGAVTYTLKTSRADLSVVPDLHEGTKTGVSHDVGWSRSFGDTSVGVTWSHSQTRDFYTYSDLLSLKPDNSGDNSSQSGNQKDSYTVSLSQSLGAWGSVSLSGTRTTQWDSSDVQNNVSLSYNTTVRDIGIGVALGYSTYNNSDSGSDDGWTGSNSGSGNKTDRTVSVNISLPLGKWLNANSVNGTYSYSRTNGQVSQQAGVSGSALNGALSWAASQGLTGNRNGNTSMSYSGNYGSLSAGYSYGAGSESVSYGVNGGLAIHPHGVTAGKQLALGGGNALVEIPGISGASVNGAVTDWRGYALVSGLTPYDRNRINVDMTNLPGNVELDASSKNVIPTRGALVEVPFRSNKGYRMMLTLERGQDAKNAVPFGAMVTLKQDDDTAMPVTGIVGDAGQVYLSGMPVKGVVTASWGDTADEQCRAEYTMPDGTDEQKLNLLSVPCQ